jgi:hypothetical protein
MPDRDYDTPRTPPATPPQVAGAFDPKSSREMREQGEREGAVLKDGSDSELETELGDELARRDKRDGSGETELNNLPPD